MGIFDFLRKKKHIDTTTNKVLQKSTGREFKIKYNVNPPTKTYEVNDDEKQFIEALFSKSEACNLQPNKFAFTRLSNGTINVDYDYYGKGGFVGKVKLQGKKKFVTYMKNLYDSVTVEGELAECINTIDFWIKYINKYLKKWNLKLL